MAIRGRRGRPVLLLVDGPRRGSPMLTQLEGLAGVVPWLRPMRSAADEAGRCRSWSMTGTGAPRCAPARRPVGRGALAGLDPLPAVPAGLLLVDGLCRGAPIIDQLEVL
jgi:hypothetical protein